MGTCDDFVDLIMDFVDGELVGPRRQCLLQHLQECEQCAAQVRNLRLLRVQLRSLPKVSTSPSFDAVLRARLRVQDKARWRRLWGAVPFASWRVSAYALAVVVVCLAALGTVLLLRHSQQLPGRGQETLPAGELAQNGPEDSAVVVNYVLDSEPFDMTLLGRGVPVGSVGQDGGVLASDSVARRELLVPPAIRPRMVSF